MSETAAVPTSSTEPVSVADQKKAVNESLPKSDQNSAAAAMEVQKRYKVERDRRLRQDGSAQYIDLSLSEKFKHFKEDPWLDESSNTISLQDGSRCKYLVLGAGFGGLLFAVKLVEAGINVDDLRMVDSAGGFGGTWYYNRYPGLMCDVESYIYMPLIEEMGYMPKNKYAYGPELRQHANNIATRWNLTDKAMFRTTVNSMNWDEKEKEWVIKMTQNQSSKDDLEMIIRSQFVLTASGVLLHPKLPDIPGLDSFKGHSFHTSRWNYQFTGGSAEDPSMTKLKDKRVGIIGTGATAIQAVPHLAEWSKHLTVFQRTPSSVDQRGNRPTDIEWWQQEVENRKGWQRERMKNFNAFVSNGANGLANMVKDGWTSMPSYRALIGGPGMVSMESVPEYVAGLHALDYPRSEKVRALVDEIVRDHETAEKLKAWYPGWCKRPCFHDEYLQSFNRSNVTLVDTDGKGVDSLTEKGVIVRGQEHELDLLIFSTGFRSPSIGSPAYRAGMTITGRNGKSLDQKWEENVATLHGVTSHDFPNLFWPGPFQAGATANQVYVLDQLSTHVAYIISEASKAAEKRRPGAKFSIEPTLEAEEAWSMQVLYRAASFAGLSGCTPGYLNKEGDTDRLPMEERMKAARSAIWGEGMNSYVKVIEGWRSAGRLEGLDIKVKL